MFNLTKGEIEEKGAVHTSAEINQQPVVWKELTNGFVENNDKRKKFVKSIFNKHDRVRVIFTGAGTSAFVGDTITPVLNQINADHIEFTSIPTTDIVSNPEQYLHRDIPTMMVSMARSGNSPESVAAVELGQKRVNYFYQVVITCNEEGKLVKNTKDDENSITLLMPAAANDQSLAMTSSFTSMVMGAYALFNPHMVMDESLKNIINNGEHLVNTIGNQVDEVLDFDFNRAIYLGSGSLGQLGHEASLKMLELTAGNVVAMYESSLGFRHGPKSILDDKSLVVFFLSQDTYTRKYDLDMLRELAASDSSMKLVVLTEKSDDELEKLADWVIQVNQTEIKIDSDVGLGLLYIIFAQVLAMKKSIQLGITPDNPSPTGAISRVVKGVVIHEYEE